MRKFSSCAHRPRWGSGLGRFGERSEYEPLPSAHCLASFCPMRWFLLSCVGRDCARRRTHFLCFAKESKQRKASRSQGPSGSLRCSQRAGSGANSLRSNKHPPLSARCCAAQPCQNGMKSLRGIASLAPGIQCPTFFGSCRYAWLLSIRSPPMLATEAGLRVGAIWRACEYEPRPAAPPLVPRAVFLGASTCNSPLVLRATLP